jgi:tRNA (5-methylaminomethyl-2-thiouridylate)-methyltransferase
MKVAVLVSGGVDSSVALAELARDPALELTAFYLKIWLEDELAYLGACPWEDDLRHARSVCDQLGVKLEVLPLQRAYHERVVAHELAELARGRTPSPDIHCNTHIKFGAFLDSVGEFDRVATGHYAGVEHRDGLPARLCMAADVKKDQTYFLSRLRPDQLARALFPLAALQKAEVRERARALSLATAHRPDSQGICFLGQIAYPEFVRFHLGERRGPIIDADTGQLLGEHHGVWFHTVGQRKGLGLSGGPWFVTQRDLDHDTLFVAHASRVEAHHRRRFEVADPHWLGAIPLPGDALRVKLRHGPRLVSCTLAPSPTSPGRLVVELAIPDQGVAPGQFAVFYRDRECLGSAVIA